MPVLRHVACALTIALATTTAAADKLDDFRDAVTRTGCDAIPYSDLRNACRSQQADVHPWCDGARGPVTCSVETASLKSAHESAKRDLASLQEKRRDLEDRRGRAADDAERSKLTSELDSVDKQIDALEASIDTLRNNLERRKDFVENALHTLGRCIDYRRAVMNVFAYATDKVRGENDPAIRPYAETLRDLYPEAISGHENQIKNKTNALENCKKEMP